MKKQDEQARIVTATLLLAYVTYATAVGAAAGVVVGIFIGQHEAILGVFEESITGAVVGVTTLAVGWLVGSEVV